MAARFSYPHSQDKPFRLFICEKLKNTNRIKPEALSRLPGGMGCLKIRSPIGWRRPLLRRPINSATVATMRFAES